VPRERTGQAMGWLQVGMWCGISTGPLAGGLLSDHFGFRPTFIVTAALLCVAGCTMWFGIKERFVRSDRVNKGSLGFLRDWQRILSAGGMKTVLAARFAVSMGRSTLGPVMALFVLSLSGGSARAATITGVIIGIASAASTLMSVYCGKLGDRAGHEKIVFWCCVAAMLLYAPQVFTTRIWQLGALFALSGAAVGGLVPCMSALLARCSAPGDEGSVYGIDNSLMSAGRTIGPLLGTSFAVWLGLRSAFGVTAFIFALAAVLTASMLPRKKDR
jgi:DHA1 family multidrug resistance protein-like MFS transporter